uniref:Outer capsid glycoprotein VP7 n=1 Tax=Rotavirus B TaxID=28876 RepID=A0A5Q2V4L3_9REOV|nr:outer capsid protein VP7 [Rotavirus B]QGH58947.1 outer capsid protein VP7 [Rotavirus B]
MAFTLLLVLAACANAQLNIIPTINPEVCILYPDETKEAKEYFGNFTEIFESYNHVTISLTNYSTKDYDVIDILSKYDYQACDILAVYVLADYMDFVTFLQSENNCSKFSGRKIHYVQLPRDQEWFVYSKGCLVCPLSDELIGIFCDTQLFDTYFELAPKRRYNVTDIPEFTKKAYPVCSDNPFYICQRITENPWINVHYFYDRNAPSGTVSNRINWGNVWTNVASFAQMLYKVLDIFFNSSRSAEPRA